MNWFSFCSSLFVRPNLYLLTQSDSLEQIALSSWEIILIEFRYDHLTSSPASAIQNKASAVHHWVGCYLQSSLPNGFTCSSLLPALGQILFRFVEDDRQPLVLHLNKWFTHQIMARVLHEWEFYTYNTLSFESLIDWWRAKMPCFDKFQTLFLPPRLG